ncbi:MAG: SulP family inorganic anion transporter [Deltaproteobacteria bacterium]|nr:SulP family inorganic anion transporter [Deltaproteobacteria bacterium]
MSIPNDLRHLPKVGDLASSLVVFLIALPLSMGIAIASDVPPALGMVTAVIGGIVVGLFGGAHLQISGPSAGLAVLVAGMVASHGIESFSAMVILAGVIQLASGLLKGGRYFQAVSPAVVRGMLTGIGILIIASQFHVMIDDKIQESGIKNILAIPKGFWKALTNTGDLKHMEAALIGVSTLMVTALWDKFKRGRWATIPGPLLGVVLGAALAAAFGLTIRYVVVPQELADLVQIPSIAALTTWSSSMLFDAVGLAFVASAETLLCATAVASMHTGPRTDYNRELAAHGFANMLCGIVGALPMTGVISRSTANVQAGALSRWSSLLHALWIALVVVLAPGLLALVPMSSLAAVLVYIGFKLLNIPAVISLAKYGRHVLGIFVATVVGVVAVDLLTGIIIGLALSAFLLMQRMSDLDLNAHDNDDNDELEVDLIGAATFLALPRFAELFDALPQGRVVRVHFEDLSFIDHACLDRIGDFKTHYEESGGTVIIAWEELKDHYLRGPKVPDPRAE